MILIEFEYVSMLFPVSLALAHMTICKTSALVNDFSMEGVFDDSHHGRVLRACWGDVFSKTSSIP